MKRLLSGTIATACVVLGVVLCTAQAQQPACNSGTVSIPFLTKPDDGWDVSFVKQENVISSGEYILSDGKDSGLRYVQLEARKQVITLPHIEVDPCNNTGTIREWHLIPKQGVTGFEKNGHLFAYQVWVQMVAGPGPDSQVIGSNTHVIFYDMHGNGIFDSVRLGAGIGMPLVPDWVEKGSNSSARQPNSTSTSGSVANPPR